MTSNEQKVYSGLFVGYAMVNGVRKTPTDGVVFSSGKGEAIYENAGKIYYVFKGPHTALLYRANIDWLIVQSAAMKWAKRSVRLRHQITTRSAYLRRARDKR